MLKHVSQRVERHAGLLINRTQEQSIALLGFKAPQEQIECYQLGYRLIGLG